MKLKKIATQYLVHLKENMSRHTLSDVLWKNVQQAPHWADNLSLKVMGKPNYES